MPPRASSIPQPWPAWSPDPAKRDRTAVARRGTKAAHHRLADARRSCEIPKSDAVEDILAGRELFEQQLGREIAVRQSIHKGAVAHSLEVVGGGDLDLHPSRPIATCPDHPGIDAHVARLQAVGDERPVGGAAQIRLGDAGGPCERGGGERSRGRGAGDEAAAGQRPACHAHETSSRYRSGAEFNHFSSSSARRVELTGGLRARACSKPSVPGMSAATCGITTAGGEPGYRSSGLRLPKRA